jgi:hypothetical protein
MTKFVAMSHDWHWLAPANLEDTLPFVDAYNEAVDPFGINLAGRISVETFVLDEEYDRSEFTLWAEHAWHMARMKADAKYATELGSKRWLDFLRVVDELLLDGPEVDFLEREFELNPDATAPTSSD